jgi:hypothetical protein
LARSRRYQWQRRIRFRRKPAGELCRLQKAYGALPRPQGAAMHSLLFWKGFAMRFSPTLALAGSSLLLLVDQYAAAQAAAGYYPGSRAASPGAVRPASYEQVSGRSNPALNFYGGSKALAYAPQNRVQPSAPVGVQTAAGAKPFTGYQNTSNVTPYLALDFTENPTSLPNYYMFVRPQLEQQQINQTERAQVRRVQQQLRKAAAGGAVSNPNGGIPTTGHSSQFMNIGGYYPNMK